MRPHRQQPARLHRPWDSPGKKILSLISITVGTLSGMALHNSIQNHDFITAWHKDSHNLWTQQAQIDQQLQTRINELQTVVINIKEIKYSNLLS